MCLTLACCCSRWRWGSEDRRPSSYRSHPRDFRTTQLPKDATGITIIIIIITIMKEVCTFEDRVSPGRYHKELWQPQGLEHQQPD
jgi:hypothetical protein